MFTVVVVGALHGLFILPVFLSLIGPLYGPTETGHNDLSSEVHDKQDKTKVHCSSGDVVRFISLEEPYKVPRPNTPNVPNVIDKTGTI